MIITGKGHVIFALIGIKVYGSIVVNDNFFWRFNFSFVFRFISRFKIIFIVIIF